MSNQREQNFGIQLLIPTPTKTFLPRVIRGSQQFIPPFQTSQNSSSMATSSTAAALQILNLSISRPYQPPRLFTCLPLPRGQGVPAVKTAAIRSSWPPTLGSRGTGLLERPMLEQSQFDPLPQPEQGGNMGQLRDKIGLRNGDSYKVLLIDDARHSEKLVEKALPQVVPSVTVADATLLFHESREKGAAVVIVTVKEHAEFYAEMMINNGLQSAIEPDE